MNAPEITAETLTDEQIRAYRRAHPESLDMLMVAIYSHDGEMRVSFRSWFAAVINAQLHLHGADFNPTKGSTR